MKRSGGGQEPGGRVQLTRPPRKKGRTQVSGSPGQSGPQRRGNTNGNTRKTGSGRSDIVDYDGGGDVGGGHADDEDDESSLEISVSDISNSAKRKRGGRPAGGSNVVANSTVGSRGSAKQRPNRVYNSHGATADGSAVVRGSVTLKKRGGATLGPGGKKTSSQAIRKNIKNNSASTKRKPQDFLDHLDSDFDSSDLDDLEDLDTSELEELEASYRQRYNLGSAGGAGGANGTSKTVTSKRTTGSGGATSSGGGKKTAGPPLRRGGEKSVVSPKAVDRATADKRAAELRAKLLATDRSRTHKAPDKWIGKKVTAGSQDDPASSPSVATKKNSGGPTSARNPPPSFPAGEQQHYRNTYQDGSGRGGSTPTGSGWRSTYKPPPRGEGDDEFKSLKDQVLEDSQRGRPPVSSAVPDSRYYNNSATINQVASGHGVPSGGEGARRDDHPRRDSRGDHDGRKGDHNGRHHHRRDSRKGGERGPAKGTAKAGEGLRRDSRKGKGIRQGGDSRSRKAGARELTEPDVRNDWAQGDWYGHERAQGSKPGDHPRRSAEGSRGRQDHNVARSSRGKPERLDSRRGKGSRDRRRSGKHGPPAYEYRDDSRTATGRPSTSGKATGKTAPRDSRPRGKPQHRGGPVPRADGSEAYGHHHGGKSGAPPAAGGYRQHGAPAAPPRRSDPAPMVYTAATTSRGAPPAYHGAPPGAEPPLRRPPVQQLAPQAPDYGALAPPPTVYPPGGTVPPTSLGVPPGGVVPVAYPPAASTTSVVPPPGVASFVPPGIASVAPPAGITSVAPPPAYSSAGSGYKPPQVGNSRFATTDPPMAAVSPSGVAAGSPVAPTGGAVTVSSTFPVAGGAPAVPSATEPLQTGLPAAGPNVPPPAGAVGWGQHSPAAGQHPPWTGVAGAPPGALPQGKGYEYPPGGPPLHPPGPGGPFPPHDVKGSWGKDPVSGKQVWKGGAAPPPGLLHGGYPPYSNKGAGLWSKGGVALAPEPQKPRIRDIHAERAKEDREKEARERMMAVLRKKEREKDGKKSRSRSSRSSRSWSSRSSRTSSSRSSSKNSKNKRGGKNTRGRNARGPPTRKKGDRRPRWRTHAEWSSSRSGSSRSGSSGGEESGEMDLNEEEAAALAAAEEQKARVFTEQLRLASRLNAQRAAIAEAIKKLQPQEYTEANMLQQPLVAQAVFAARQQRRLVAERKKLGMELERRQAKRKLEIERQKQLEALGVVPPPTEDSSTQAGAGQQHPSNFGMGRLRRRMQDVTQFITRSRMGAAIPEEQMQWNPEGDNTAMDDAMDQAMMADEEKMIAEGGVRAAEAARVKVLKKGEVSAGKIQQMSTKTQDLVDSWIREQMGLEGSDDKKDAASSSGDQTDKKEDAAKKDETAKSGADETEAAGDKEGDNKKEDDKKTDDDQKEREKEKISFNIVVRPTAAEEVAAAWERRGKADAEEEAASAKMAEVANRILAEAAETARNRLTRQRLQGTGMLKGEGAKSGPGDASDSPAEGGLVEGSDFVENAKVDPSVVNPNYQAPREGKIQIKLGGDG